MDPGLNWTATAVFVFFLALVTVIGLYAGRWRKGDLGEIEEWGLAGRRFGTIVTWFLIGGDFYTAYTLVAVPAPVYGVDAFLCRISTPRNGERSRPRPFGSH